MKKLLFTLILAFAALGSAPASNPLKLISVVNEYDGVDVVKIGPLGMGLIRMAARVSADSDKETLEVLSSIKGLKNLTILDFEDAPRRAEIAERIEKLLQDNNLILEAKDDGETVRIYGLEEGRYLKDCVIYSSDGTLIFARGKVDIDRIMALAQ